MRSVTLERSGATRGRAKTRLATRRAAELPKLRFLVLALAATTAAGQDLQVDLELGSGGSIGLDEVAVLNIRIDGAGRQPARPEADFKLDNLRVVAGPSISNRLRFMDAVSSRSWTLTWHLQPLAVGTARVHSALLRLGTRNIPLPDDQIEVVAAASRRRPGRRRQPFVPRDFYGEDSPQSPSPQRRLRRRPAEPPELYLSADVEPGDPYVGEQVLYTLYLFTQADVRSVNPETIPDFKGFWSRVVPQPDQLRPKMIFHQGKRIGRVVLLQRALFPRRAGSFEIEPIQARLSALLPDSNPYGSLLPRSREIARSSNAVTVDVRELPPPPAGFQGAVGQLTLTAELAPTELEVGEAATLALTITGRGHFQGLPPPLLPELAGIRVFPPQQQSEESVEHKNVSGERTWSFVLVPERSGRWQMPAIEVPYFDPWQERYMNAGATPLALEVTDPTKPSAADGQLVEPHSIRTAALPAPGAASLVDPRPWLFGLPWGLAAILVLARHRLASGYRPHRGRLLERLREAVTERQPRQAAADIENAWREFLHDRWDLPPGLPSTRWGTMLAARGATRNAADELVKLADDLHYLRYAPKLSSTEGLQRELVERSRKLARAIG